MTGAPVATLADLPPARATLFDVTPRQLLAITGDRLPARYRRRLERYRYGPGVFKIDAALDGPIPWRAADCARAGTVHLGGTLAEVAAAESAVWRGGHPERPFVLVAQQSLFDPTRAPAGPAHAVGLLPRAQRIHGGHDRAHPRPDRALRAGRARPHPRPAAHGPAALERQQRELHRAETSGAARTSSTR